MKPQVGFKLRQPKFFMGSNNKHTESNETHLRQRLNQKLKTKTQTQLGLLEISTQISQKRTNQNKPTSNFPN